ncbi:MAG TPA: hypothetical protein VKU88_05740 [Acidimicrobiales bacterium]|nr:hypothetical protein [Acidimicrobiales bacterium]
MSSVGVQAVCAGLYVNHAGLLADAVVFALVMDALTHQVPADAARIPASVCAQQIIPGVSPPAAVTGNAEVYVDAARAFGSQPGVGQAPPLAPYAEGR